MIEVYIDGQIEVPRVRAFFARSDARSDRFGPFAGYPGVGGTPTAGKTIREGAGAGWESASGAYIGLYSDNTAITANGALLSDADAETLRLALTTNAPFLNRSEMVTRLMPALSSSGDNWVIKRRREAVVRALADVGDTRTWNLLIDLIAQSGRFPRTASSLDSFQVEGERHYWLHVAIDRFTGKVIARKLEAVSE